MTSAVCLATVCDCVFCSLTKVYFVSQLMVDIFKVKRCTQLKSKCHIFR